MNHSPYRHLPVIPHAGYLGELRARPAYLGSDSEADPDWPFYCGGLHGEIKIQQSEFKSESWSFKPGIYLVRCYYLGQLIERRARLDSQGILETTGQGLMSGRGAVFLAELEHEGQSWTLLLRELETRAGDQGYVQSFQLYRTVMQRTDRELQNPMPDAGSVRFRIGMGENRSLFPLQLMPSVLDVTGRRIALHYSEAVERLADLLLAHRPPYGRTLVYADESVDYFGVFALQETGRLLGIRNLYGSAIWAPQAVGMGAALQRGHEAPILTLDQALEGPGRLFLLNGWNGFVTHLPMFERLMQLEDLDAWLITVMTTETAKVLAERLGSERVLVVKPGGESMLALAIAHELLERYPESVAKDFLERCADPGSYQEYIGLARSEIFAPEKVASLIVPEPGYEDRLLQGIHVLAERLAQPGTIPIHLPGADLIQSGGMAAYCLWTNLLAMTGKFGRQGHESSRIRGGELRVLTLGNEETQLQGLGPDLFFGCLPISEDGCREAAERMQLPADAYAGLLREPVRPILEFSEPNQGAQRELILCIGTGLESRWMRDHQLWHERLRRNDTTLVVIDSMPGPFLLRHAALCLPTPPAVSQHQLNQNGEWRLIQSYPRRSAPAETLTAATIMYDAMAEISRSLRESDDFRQGHPDLAARATEGYLQVRFEPPEWGWGGQLRRVGGEVLRPQLWERIQDYLGGPQPLFCRPEDAQGQALSWSTLMHEGSCLHGQSRHETQGFADLHRQSVKFRFFVPQEEDFALPAGVVLNIGSAIPDPQPADVRFAIAASSAAVPLLQENMPKQRTLYVATSLAVEKQLEDGDMVTLHHSEAASLNCQIQVSNWLKGSMVYFHHYMTQPELDGELVIPWLRFKVETCGYSQVPLLKKVQVRLEKEEPADDRLE
ncbi:MAG: hypothetical protein ACAI44_00875 [Candidatus Sericytochromatia bacterium]